MNSGLATIDSVIDEGSVVIELGSGERKTARLPGGSSAKIGDKVLFMQVSGKYLIINTY